MLKYKYSEYSNKGLIRDENEDTIGKYIIGNEQIFVLCDGMGGAANGKEASNTVVRSVFDYFNENNSEELKDKIINSIKKANENIQSIVKTYPQKKGMGTTICLSVFAENDVFVAHVGDSRVYLFTDKKLFQLTTDHSYVNQLYESGIISFEDLKNHKETNRILKAIGTSDSISPTITTNSLKLKENDIILQCSDGLSDLVEAIEIQEILNRNETLDTSIQNLKNKAFDRGAKDNISIQLIKITESSNKKTVFVDKTIRNKTKDNSNKKNLKIAVGVVLSILAFVFFANWILSLSNNKEIRDEIKENKVLNTQINQEIFKETKRPVLDYFIIGEDNNLEKRIFRNLYRYKLATGDSTPYNKFELINNKKTVQFKIGDTVYIPK